MAAIGDYVSFEPDKVIVARSTASGSQLEPGQTVVSHGIDRDLSVSEVQAVV